MSQGVECQAGEKNAPGVNFQRRERPLRLPVAISILEILTRKAKRQDALAAVQVLV